MFLKKKKEEINRATYLKYESGYYIMEKWVRVKQKGISLCQFFEDNNINKKQEKLFLYETNHIIII